MFSSMKLEQMGPKRHTLIVRTKLWLLRKRLVQKVYSSKTARSVALLVVVQVLLSMIWSFSKVDHLNKPITIKDATSFDGALFGIEYSFIPPAAVDFGHLGYPSATIVGSEDHRLSLLHKQLHADFDPRLMPALLLHMVRRNIMLNDGSLEPRFSVPFSWSSWLDLGNSFSKDLNSLGCSELVGHFGLTPGHEFLEACVDIKNSPKAYPSFKLISPVDCEMTEQLRRFAGSNYLLHSAPIPERIAIMGIEEKSSTHESPDWSTLIVPTFKNSHTSVYGHHDRDYMIQTYGKKNSVSLRNELDILSTYWQQSKQSEFVYSDEYQLSYETFRAVNRKTQVSLSVEDFVLNLNSYVQTLSENLAASVNAQVINEFERKLLSDMKENLKHNDIFPKYFHEALTLGDKRGHHYDWRFFQNLSYSEYEKTAVLHRLTRAWLRFARSIGIKSWLAHGSLLGWYWNGMTMPWDPDLDVQVTVHSLLLLARNYNQTLVVDSQAEIGSYLLDVGPSYFSRHKANGLNTIDARFIDTATGFYVDITALAFNGASSQQHTKWNMNEQLEFKKVLDPEYKQKERSTILPEDLKQQLESRRNNVVQAKQLFNCKNHHFYTLNELEPLQPTFFEGVLTLVPHNYMGILDREYPHGLYSKEHSKHKFRPILDLWVPTKICPRDNLGNKCNDVGTNMEAEAARPITSRHRIQMRSAGKPKFEGNWKMGELPSCRIDPWLVLRSRRLQQLMAEF